MKGIFRHFPFSASSPRFRNKYENFDLELARKHWLMTFPLITFVLRLRELLELSESFGATSSPELSSAKPAATFLGVLSFLFFSDARRRNDDVDLKSQHGRVTVMKREKRSPPRRHRVIPLLAADAHHKDVLLFFNFFFRRADAAPREGFKGKKSTMYLL